MTVKKAITIGLLALIIAVLSASAQSQWVHELSIQSSRPVHDLNAHFTVKPIYFISAIPFIKPLHQVVFEPKPLPDISNATAVEPFLQTKSKVVHTIKIGMEPKNKIDLGKGIPGHMSF